jgi:hypothetical protein
MEGPAAVSFASLFSALGNRNLISYNNPWAVVYGDSNQARARNILFKQFLSSPADRMLAIDPDQTFTMKEIDALLDVEKDVVVPIISRRLIDGGPVGMPIAGHEVPEGNHLIEMARIGFGLVVFSRECVHKLSESRIKKNATFQYNGELIPEIVSQKVVNGKWLGVDDVFSERWRSLGGKMWLHAGVRVGHIGNHIYF